MAWAPPFGSPVLLRGAGAVARATSSGRCLTHVRESRTVPRVRTVVETNAFLTAAKSAGMSEDERSHVVEQ